MTKTRLRIRKRGRDEWDEGPEDSLPPCPLVLQPMPMENKANFPQLQRACPDGVDTRSSWTLEQLECLWAELDELLAEVDDRRSRLHGERASLAVWMALSMLKSPNLVTLDDEAVSGARTRSSAMAGGLDTMSLGRQLSITLNNKGSRDRHGRFLKTDAESPRAEAKGDTTAHASASASGATARLKGSELPADYEHEGEAAGYEIRRVSAEADPEALWQFTDAFFEPLAPGDMEVLDADVRVRRFCVDELEMGGDPFEVCPRGRHYLLQWEEEAQLLGLAQNGAYATPAGAAGGGDSLRGRGAAAALQQPGLLHWQEDLADSRRLTSRVFSALVDRPGFIPRIDIAPTRAGAVDSLSQPSAPAVMSVAGEDETRERRERIDLQLRAELLKVGLLDSADAVLGDEDDSLCAELRLAQAQLRVSIAQNEALCRESRVRFQAFLEAQAHDQQKHAQADALVERWRVVMKRLKAERKAERRRKKAAGGGRKAADVVAPAVAPEEGNGATQPPAAVAVLGAGPDEAAPAMEGDGASNDESSEEEREEEPGPGWGAAAPDAIASAAAPTPSRPTAARKRTTRAHPGTSPGGHAL